MNADTTETPAKMTANRSREAKVKHVCRTCLFAHKKHHTSVFAVDSVFDMRYSDIISAVTGVEISEEDGLTGYICAVCKQNAKAAYQYKLQAQKSDDSLRNAAPSESFTQNLKYMYTDTEDETEETQTNTLLPKLNDTNIGKRNAKKKNKSKEIKPKVEKKMHDVNIIRKSLDNNKKGIKIESKFFIKKESYSDDDDFYDRGDSHNSLLDESFSLCDNVKPELVKAEVPLTCHRCEVCDCTFETLLALHAHAQTCMKVEKAEEKANYCPVCVVKFENPVELVRHARTHTLRTRVVISGDVQDGTQPTRITNIEKKKLYLDARKKAQAITHALQAEAEEDRIEEERIEDQEYVQGIPDRPRCGICVNVFETDEKLIAHFQTHSDFSVLHCLNCDALFVEAMYLSRHWSSKHKRQGPLPKTDQTNLGDLIRTYKKSLPDVEVYLALCPQCGQLTMSAKDLTDHNSMVHSDFCHPCTSCLKLFRDASVIKAHNRLCRPMSRHKCQVCSQEFMHAKSLDKHMLSKHNPRVEKRLKKYACTICSRSFTRESIMFKHKFGAHAPKKIFECDICHNKVQNKSYLKTHIANHNPMLQNSHLCQQCGRRFNNQSSLYIHTRIHHKREKPHVCSYCQKEKTLADRKHIATHAADYKRAYLFLCPECGHAASCSSTLTVHIRRKHSGERPYKCSHCPQAFPRSTDLKTHERKHTGERPYSCKVCGMKFAKSYAVLRHMRTHTGERPYQCCYCDRAFSQSQDLTKHERRHTGEAVHSCAACATIFSQAKELRDHRKSCAATSALATPADAQLALIKEQMDYARYLQKH